MHLFQKNELRVIIDRATGMCLYHSIYEAVEIACKCVYISIYICIINCIEFCVYSFTVIEKSKSMNI